jgi:hypothetical protein
MGGNQTETPMNVCWPLISVRTSSQNTAAWRSGGINPAVMLSD